MLCEALKLTGVAGRPGEFFDPQDMALCASRWGVSNYTDNFTDYFIKAIEHGTTPNGVFGAKVMWGYFKKFAMRLRTVSGCESVGLPELVTESFPNLHYIWITRRDKIRQAISFSRAIQSDIWSSTTDPLPEMMRAATFDFEEIENLRRRLQDHDEKWRRYFDQCGAEPLTVVYEDFTTAYEATAIEILNYLSVEAPEVIPFEARSMRRQADTISEEWVERYSHETRRRAHGYRAAVAGDLRAETMPSPRSEGTQPGHVRAQLDRASPEHEARRSCVLRLEIEAVLPPGARVALVDKGRPLELTDGRAAIAFPEVDGNWAGYPADDLEAIAELERLRAKGVRFVAFPGAMRYWLETYPAWASYLREGATTRVDNEQALIFELS
jgi:LPS sulfotransferase NodH